MKTPRYRNRLCQLDRAAVDAQLLEAQRRVALAGDDLSKATASFRAAVQERDALRARLGMAPLSPLSRRNATSAPFLAQSNDNDNSVSS